MLKVKSACLSKLMALPLFISMIVGQGGCHRAKAGSDNSPAFPTQSQTQLAVDYQSFIGKLHAQGARVKAGDDVSQPFFSAKGRTVSINDESVQAFEYASVGDAEAEARKVAPRGDAVGTSHINWVSPPHFFRVGKLIVLYVGDNTAMMKILESVLGKQFAGA